MTVQPVGTLPDEVDRVWFEVDRLMAFIVEVAEDLGVALPADRYFDLGEPVHACPAVVVAVATTNTGLPEAPPPGLGEFAMHQQQPAWTLILVADIIRCAAVPKQGRGTVPYDQLIAQVKQASADTAVLIGAANKRTQDRWGQLTGAITYLEPQGNAYATRLALNIAVH